MCRHDDDDDDDAHYAQKVPTSIHASSMHVMMHAHTYMAMMGVTYQPAYHHHFTWSENIFPLKWSVCLAAIMEFPGAKCTPAAFTDRQQLVTFQMKPNNH